LTLAECSSLSVAIPTSEFKSLFAKLFKDKLLKYVTSQRGESEAAIEFDSEAFNEVCHSVFGYRFEYETPITDSSYYNLHAINSVDGKGEDKSISRDKWIAIIEVLENDYSIDRYPEFQNRSDLLTFLRNVLAYDSHWVLDVANDKISEDEVRYNGSAGEECSSTCVGMCKRGTGSSCLFLSGFLHSNVIDGEAIERKERRLEAFNKKTDKSSFILINNKMY